MNLDSFSVMVLTTVVINVSGIIFIVDTVIRRDDGAGRIWALGFLSAMLTTIAYLVWSFDSSAWWAVAAGNAAFVAATGAMWLGCVRFNGGRMRIPSILVGVAAVGALVAALVQGPTPGGWSGAVWMFIALLVLAALGALECAHGDMRRSRTSWALAVVLGVQAAWYVPRTLIFVLAGPDSPLFVAWFGTTATSFLTVTLTIVALVVTSVLRASRAEMRGHDRPRERAASGGDILRSDLFRGVFAELVERAKARSELVGAIAVRIEDLEQISTAFGSETARSVTEAWRDGVRRHAPAMALVGEDGATGIVVGIVATDSSDARRQAARIYRGLFTELGAVTGGVIPVVGVGVGLSDAAGYDADAIVQLARSAARRAATTVESSVLVGDAG